MTIPQAKKQVAAKLSEASVAYESLKGYTVDFTDLLRLRVIFIEVKGIDFQQTGILAKWDTIKSSIAKPSEGGFVLKSR